MSSSPENEPVRPSTSEDTEAHREAERAADALKAQIAAIRQRVRDAHRTLNDQAKRERERRSFKP